MNHDSDFSMYLVQIFGDNYHKNLFTINRSSWPTVQYSTGLFLSLISFSSCVQINQDCSISPSGDGNGSGMCKNFAWVGVDPYSSGGGYHPYPEKRKYVEYETLEDELQEEEEQVQEIETLPLFPMHAEHTFKQEPNFYNGWEYGPQAEDNNNVGSSRASLELSLNSYSARLLNSPWKWKFSVPPCYDEGF